MSFVKTKFVFFIFTAIVCAALFSPAAALTAQKRDHLNEAEVELVRQAQAIDLRTEVFVRAIDRRFLALNDQTEPVDKKSKYDADIWGEAPTGTRLQLLTDIRKILDEAISNIDDVAAHSNTAGKLFPKAVRKLSEAAAKYLPQLKSALDRTEDEKEKGAILSSVESCEQIVEASAKVPKDESKSKKDN